MHIPNKTYFLAIFADLLSAGHLGYSSWFLKNHRLKISSSVDICLLNQYEVIQNPNTRDRHHGSLQSYK